MNAETTTVETSGAITTGDPKPSVAAHTPGPWEVEYSPVRNTLCIVSGTTWICGELQADNETSINTSECEANARLIAAAPELLDALQAVKPLMIPGMNWTDETGEFVKSLVVAAIAKATGAAP